MIFRTALLASVACMGVVQAACDTSTMQMEIGTASRLSFVGFEPNIVRLVEPGMDSKIIFKNYARMPMITENPGGIVSVIAGDFCDGTVPSTPPEQESSASKKLVQLPTMVLPMLLGHQAGLSSVWSTGLGLAALGFKSVQAQPLDSFDITACDVVPIDVEIYVDATADEIVMRNFKSGDFEECPPETVYWKHHPKVFGGYEGCVGEKGYYPCEQDSQGVWEEEGALAAKYPFNWDAESMTCVDTGYTTETRTFWILWGDPLDKHELNERTGFNPVVSFPFNRGPYPKYEQGVPIEDAIDDSSDARAMAKDLLVYIGAFTETELDDWEVTMTEGAEAGMTSIWAGKALEIARSTCNRDIYALMEVPAYGYSPSDAAAMVNTEADTFYIGEECLCFNTTEGCNAPTVTVNNYGWVPLTDVPVEMGGDGTFYAADSGSPNSPWMESMVFPENPTGKIKTPQLPDANRRVCDGVYVWPMYFGMTENVVPIDDRPDCSAWSFSITKAYSASVRAGFIIYKKNPETSKLAMVDIQSKLYSMTHGLYSEWSWFGQMQLWEMIMSRPVDDPTSWIGAYSAIMREKWDVIVDAFADCPVVRVTNPQAGAYAWLKYEPEYTGIQDGFISSFFRDVLGIRTTTYNFGFRGVSDEDIASFYGEGYTSYDFTRLQLYRDIEVYKEVARRVKIVCADPDAVIGDFVSVNQWKDAAADRTRRLEGAAPMALEDRKGSLQDSVPSLTDRQLESLALGHHDADALDRRLEKCGPDFTMTCLFKEVGTSFQDF